MPRNTYQCLWMGLAFVALITLLPAAHAAEGDFSAADKTAIRAYVLTVNKLNGFIAGTAALASAKNTDSALASEMERMDTEPGRTLAELRAKVTRHPKVFAYYQRQGLSADDTVLLPLVTTYAGAALALNNPNQFGDTTSQAQLNFVRTNPALVQRLSEANDALDDAQ